LTAPIRIISPGSTANLGSAFDCAAIALSVYNHIEAQVATADSCTVVGEGHHELNSGTRNLVLIACDRACAELGVDRPPLALRLENHVPFGRGLGSSASAIAAGLRLAEVLAGQQLGESRLLTLAAAIEGHADNTSAAILGGCAVATSVNGVVQALRIHTPPDLCAVVFVPDYAVATSAARAALPSTIPLADGVFNVGRSALLVAALGTGRLDLLSAAMEDRLHQPYRARLYRGMNALMAAARHAGAYGAAVSGAGPSTLALASSHSAPRVALALEDTANRQGIAGKTLVLLVDEGGARVRTSLSSPPSGGTLRRED
jgi:homoserine kinase